MEAAPQNGERQKRPISGRFLLKHLSFTGTTAD